MLPIQPAVAEARVDEIIDALPKQSFLGNYVRYASRLTDASSMYHLGAGLAVLSQAIPRDLNIRQGNRLYSNIYVLLVGDSTGSRKTTAVSLAREVLREAMPDRVGGNPGSWEGLADSLKTTPQQLVTYGEFGQFLAQAKEGYFAAIKQTLTGAYDGEPIERLLSQSKSWKQQQGGGSSSIKIPTPDPRLSLIGAVTPGFLSDLSTASDWEDGFFGRFLTFYAIRNRTYARTPADLTDQRAWLAMKLRRISPTLLGPPPACGGIADDAVQEWTDWQASHDRLAKENPWGAAAIGRAQGNALKIAMMFAWDDRDGVVPEPGWQISRANLLSAMSIVQLHIESVLAVVSKVGGTKDMNDRGKVLDALVASAPEWVPLGVITLRAKIFNDRAFKILQTVVDQGFAESRSVSNEGARVTEWRYTEPSREVFVQVNARGVGEAAQAPGQALFSTPLAQAVALAPAPVQAPEQAPNQNPSWWVASAPSILAPPGDYIAPAVDRDADLM